jgi:hypothetical protein
MIDNVEQVSEQVIYVADPINPLQFLLPKAITMELRSQQTAIRGVSVDAEQCPGTVTVYGGRSAAGQGIIVQPGTARAFGIESNAAIYVVFGPASGSGGYARITAFGSPVVAYGIGTGAPALAAFATKVEGRLAHIAHVLEQILAKIP